MKIRHGFVSNSSSSSFMIVAVKYPRYILTDILADNIDKDGLSVLAHSEDGWGDRDTFLVGSPIDIENGDNSCEMTMDSLNEEWETICRVIGSEGERVIVTGTRMT